MWNPGWVHPEDELKKIEAHAYKLGVKTHTTVEAVKGYLRSYH
jgi:hypothetical protein